MLQIPVSRDRLIGNVDHLMGLPAGQPLSPEQQLAADILNESIIIERSPPVAETLINLVHGATSTSVGIWLASRFDADPYVMMITIPAGVIIMGAAFGISKGLERGIAKRLEKIVNPPATRRPKGQ